MIENRSESIGELAMALAKAQGDFENATKDKANPHFRSKYADLGNIVDAIRPALAANGLAFLQIPHQVEGAAKIETIILHSSGQYLSCGCVEVPYAKRDAHGIGSALTYARRYSLSAAFGIAPEDDDGNAAVGGKRGGQQDNQRSYDNNQHVEHVEHEEQQALSEGDYKQLEIAASQGGYGAMIRSLSDDVKACITVEQHDRWKAISGKVVALRKAHEEAEAEKAAKQSDAAEFSQEHQVTEAANEPQENPGEASSEQQSEIREPGSDEAEGDAEQRSELEAAESTCVDYMTILSECRTLEELSDAYVNATNAIKKYRSDTHYARIVKYKDECKAKLQQRQAA